MAYCHDPVNHSWLRTVNLYGIKCTTLNNVVRNLCHAMIRMTKPGPGVGFPCITKGDGDELRFAKGETAACHSVGQSLFADK